MSDYPASNPVGRGGGGMYGASNVEGSQTPPPPPPPPLQQRVLNSTPPPAPTRMNTRLTAKPHAFAGAVLSPKHARDLSPALCMAITSSLAEQNHNKATVPYTLWITEAWRVLGWAEPSAALFWEVATMYHTLQVAGRDWEQQYPGGFGAGGGHIPPILSCGSTSSLTSGATNATERAALEQHNKKKFSSAVSAKELPVWLVGTFLLLHCEEFSRQRSLSGEDERRYYGTTTSCKTADEAAAAVVAGGASRIDFTSLFKHQGLSPRTRLHAGWNNDNTHCTAYLLRHLRKILVLSAVSHNPEALVACMHLAALPTLSATPDHHHPPSSSSSITRSGLLRTNSASHNKQYSANDIRRQHDDEHESVGLTVRLTMEDLERLDLLLQPPSGGGIDDPKIKIGDFLWQSMYQDPPPPMASIPLADVEREIRQHLEMELSMTGSDETVLSSDTEDESPANALARLSLMDKKDGGGGEDEPATQQDNQYQKELSYTRLRGTTILLKPNPPETSSGASVASGEPSPFGNVAGRLHDLVISDCTDAHFYLLQPFEHATIAACTSCTIVVGAVAGLLHIVDCEKTVITSAARRILVSNSCDVQLCVFTPTQPILVGDNRTCQFAPYNTYYDGLREDLLSTGLAAAVLPENHHTRVENDVVWPPLQFASSKWKSPIEVSKLEVPQPGSPGGSSLPAPLSPGADDKATGVNDASMQAPVLVPPSDFQIVFVPIETDPSRQQRKSEAEDENEAPARGDDSSAVSSVGGGGGIGSQYCKHLSEVLHLSPFRLPPEYERRALMKAERMKNIQQAVQKNLNSEQQKRFEEELNRGFRDWLVTSGNLRQVLDLVHLEVKSTQP